MKNIKRLTDLCMFYILTNIINLVHIKLLILITRQRFTPVKTLPIMTTYTFQPA